MTRISVGDAALTNVLARQGADLRAQLQRASVEVTTGQHADVSAALRGHLSPLLAIDASLSRLSGYKTTVTDAASLAQAQQGALTALTSLATGITAPLLTSRDFKTPIQVLTLAADARGRLETALGLLNTQAAGRSVFGGTETGAIPLPDADALMTALKTATLGATTAGQVAAAVTSWFADPLGYAAFYQGGGPLSPVPIAPGESAELSTTATDPAFRATLAGLAMAALIDRGALSGNSEEQARLAERAGQELQASQDSRIALAARIGLAEGRIEAAKTRNAAEETSLGLLRSELGSVDGYEAASRLEAARTQLESLYLVTARVSRLSLVDFLR
jgi:flagellar hook-associated protein 3 FlgL